MVISREFDKDGTATALMVIKTDSEPPDALLNRLRRAGILRVKSLALPRATVEFARCARSPQSRSDALFTDESALLRDCGETGGRTSR